MYPSSLRALERARAVHGGDSLDGLEVARDDLGVDARVPALLAHDDARVARGARELEQVLQHVAHHDAAVERVALDVLDDLVLGHLLAELRAQHLPDLPRRLSHVRLPRRRCDEAPHRLHHGLGLPLRRPVRAQRARRCVLVVLYMAGSAAMDCFPQATHSAALVAPGTELGVPAGHARHSEKPLNGL